MGKRWEREVERLWEFLGRYLLRPVNGYTLATLLVMAFVGMQGIEIAAFQSPYRITFIGIDSGEGVFLVGLVSILLIASQFFQPILRSSQLEAVRNVLRLQELGYSSHEMSERLRLPEFWISGLKSTVKEYSVPLPVHQWSHTKLLQLIQSPEFAELLIRRRVLLQLRDVKQVGGFYAKWISEESFRNSFDSVEDILIWLIQDREKEGTK